MSPLKALGNDVERNLRRPLEGVRDVAQELGDPLPDLRVGLRTGDTPSAERQKMLRRPPHVLITTPESLYLMLTSEKARAVFETTHTVIVDEIHTLVGTKRGAHLALSLERLERLAAGRLQRIGLSATVRPVETAARFLGGQDPRRGHAARPVTIVAAPCAKTLDLRIDLPLDDFRDAPGSSIWSAIIPEVARLIDEHRTTLIFCNSRRLAERTADRLNEHRLREREGAGAPASAPRAGVADLGIFAAGVDSRRLEAAGLQPIRAHHGSTSKTARLDMEQALKTGKLRALVCTSSLELGIDVGDVDLVVHLQSPKSVSSGLQRVGRSGHGVGQTSVGRIFPTHADELIEAAAVAHGMLQGQIEATETPENPLDVLAQQIVAMVSVEDWPTGELLALVRGAYPFRNLGETVFGGVVEMLSGRYPETLSRQLKALVSWDRVNDRLAALPGSNVLAIGSGGTIPDRGSYALVLKDRRTRIGELDEEFVFETRPGDTFLLGSSVWRVAEISEDRVVAEPAPGEVPRMPFWRGDSPWRPYDLGWRVGAFRRELASLVRELSPDELAAIRGLTQADVEAISRGEEPRSGEPLSSSAHRLAAFLGRECGLGRNALVQAVEHVARQLDAVGELATDRTVIVEVFEDAIGDPRLVVHSPFGGRVNGPWGIALAGAVRERLGVEARAVSSDDGILLRFASAEVTPPTDLVSAVTSQEARERLLAELPGSATFGAQFRMNAARALLLPRERAGKRTPLWLSRLRAKDLLQAIQGFGDFPILLETYRDCLRDVMDLGGLTDVLDRISRGEIAVVVHEAEVPSPVALGLDYRFAQQFVYDHDVPRGERQLSALALDRDLLAELLRDGNLAGLLKPRAVVEVASRVARTGTNERARDAEELAQLLFELGDLSDDEVRARSASSDASRWIEALAQAGRALEWSFGDERRWVHAERRPEYEHLTSRPGPVLRRFLAHAGPTPLAALAARYGLALDATRDALRALGREVLAGQFAPGEGEQWIDRRNLEQMHRRTLSLLRQEVRPVSIYAYAEFLARWQGVGGAKGSVGARGGDDAEAARAALTRVLQQLRGLAVPGAIWERDVLPCRVPGLEAAALAERCHSGELLWVVEGGRDPRRARARFFFRGEGELFVERRPAEGVVEGLSAPARAVYEYLSEEGAALLVDVVEGAGLSAEAARSALVELVLVGLATNDTLEALYAVLGHGPPPAPQARPFSSLEAQLTALRPERWPARSRHRVRDARRRVREVVAAREQVRRSPWVGRWALVHRPSLLGKPLAEEEVALRQARQLLVRWGVVTKACLERESARLDWGALYPVLSRLEMRGEVRRGYFVEGLPGLQLALPDAVEQLRGGGGPRDGATEEIVPRGDGEGAIVVLNASDPAQIFGTDALGGPLRFQRVPSSAVAAWRGEPVAVIGDAGKEVVAATDHPRLAAALRALGQWWSVRVPGRLKVERWEGGPVLESPRAQDLEMAGFVRDYGGMLWVGR